MTTKVTSLEGARARAETFQRDLIEGLERQAEFRDEKAAEYPDDRRNAASADALRAMATALGTLGTNHPGMIRLRRFWIGVTNDWINEAVEVESEFLRTYGFHGPEGTDPQKFLDELASALEAVPGELES